MSHPEVKNEVPSRYPPDLYSEEIAQSLQTSAYIDEQLFRIRDLGNQLHGDGQLSPDVTRQALMIAYSALLSLKNYVAYDEFCERKHRETDIHIDQLLTELREIPPFEPVPVPDWLRDQQPEV